jgi:hypothetical protein
MVVNEEIVVAFPGPVESIAPTTEYRSTWLVSSLEGLRQQGHLDRYLDLLSAYRDEILQTVAGAWVPIEVARAHYEACDRLGLTAPEIEHMARAAGTIRRQWYSALIATAERGEATVWTVLPQLYKFWQRSATGGAVTVFSLGTNRARLEYVRCELFDIAYFREAMRVVLLLLGEHVCEDLKIRSSVTTTPGSVVYQLQWRAERKLSERSDD